MQFTDTHGLFDFQVNGFAGIDFQRPDLECAELKFAARRLREHGVAGIFLTLVTNTEDHLCAQLERLESLREREKEIHDVVWGYHVEGPWLRPEVGFAGAHRIDLMCHPSVRAFERLQAAANGNLRLVTIAPELPGSDEVIAAMTSQRVHVSLGHSDASEADIDIAIRAGARFCTHLGNGVPRMLPRHDNIIQRLLARDELYACFIPDGIHVPPFVLRNMVRAKPHDRILFTTDAMSAAGAPPGVFSFNGMELVVGQDGIVRDPGPSGGFAGSALTPDRGVELTARFLKIPQPAAHDLWSSAPLAAFVLAPVNVGGT